MARTSFIISRHGASLYDDKRADTDPLGEIVDLLIGQGDAPIRPVEIAVYADVPCPDAVNTDEPAQRRALRRCFPGADRLADLRILRLIDYPRLPGTAGLFQCRVIEAVKAVKRCLGRDADNMILSQRRLVVVAAFVPRCAA
jgi:hypothetical protein